MRPCYIPRDFLANLDQDFTSFSVSIFKCTYFSLKVCRESDSSLALFFTTLTSQWLCMPVPFKLYSCFCFLMWLHATMNISSLLGHVNDAVFDRGRAISTGRVWILNDSSWWFSSSLLRESKLLPYPYWGTSVNRSSVSKTRRSHYLLLTVLRYRLASSTIRWNRVPSLPIDWPMINP